MTGDASGRHGDPAVPERRIDARRTSPDFVAPITLGRPGRRSRSVRSARAVNAGALGSAPAFYLLWRDVASQPLAATVATAIVLMIIGHWGINRRLHHLRRRGHAMSQVLAVGAVDDVASA